MTDPVVLVALDGSDKARCALPVAKRLAELRDVPLHTLHTDEQAEGGSAQAILREAAEAQAQLIVMSAYAGGTRPADTLGEAPVAVLCGAACPVVLVDPARAPGDWRLKRVLAPHDGSPAVSGALGPAAELARRAGAELIVLQAPGAERAAERGSIASPLYMDQPQHEWPAWTSEFLQRLAVACSLTDVQVRLLVGKGAPAEEAIRTAGEESADLIVLAWRGHWQAHADQILKAVLRGAPCPVMVTRIAAA